MKRTLFVTGIIQFALGGALSAFAILAMLQESFFFGAMTGLALIAFVLNILCVKSDDKKDGKDMK